MAVVEVVVAAMVVEVRDAGEGEGEGEGWMLDAGDAGDEPG